jgi:two-component system, cell cycle sensor histidine kinase and response regulator CckA
MDRSKDVNDMKLLYAEQVKQLYRHIPIGLIATLVNSLILTFMLWEVISPAALIIWFAACVSVVLFRYLLFLKFWGSSPKQTETSRQDMWFRISIAFSGIVWGSAGIFLFPVDSIAHQIFIAFVLGGMVAGAAGTFSVIIGTFIVYSLPALVPIIVRFFAVGDHIHVTMGGMTILFGLLMFLTAKRVNTATVASLKLQIENKDLIHRLERRVKERTTELLKANEKLKRKVEEHLKTEKALRKTKERYSLATSSARVGVWDWNIKTGEFYLDQNVKAIIGFNDNEIPNDLDAWATHVHPDDRQPVMDALHAHMEGKTPEYVSEHRTLHKDGSIRWILVHGAAIRDGQNKVVRVVGTHIDITERKQAENALHRYKLLSAHIRDIIFFIRREDGRILDVNNAAITAYGYSREELLQMTVYDMREPGMQSLIYDQMAEADIAGILFETVHRRKDGKTFPVEVSSQGATLGDMRMLINIVRDISKRKDAEQALRESQADLKRAQIVAQTGSWRLDVRRNKLRWSDETHRIFGMPKETAMTYETFLAAIHPEDRQYVDRHWQEALQGKTYDIEHRIVVGDTVKWVRERAELEFEKGGTLIGGFGTVQDITESKHAEEALREREQFISRVMNASINALYIRNVASGRNEFMNAQYFHLTGWTLEEIKRMDKEQFDALVHSEDQNRVFEHMQAVAGSSDGEILEIEYRFQTKEGGWLWCRSWDAVFERDQEGAAKRILGTFLDITEHKRAEEERLQMERRVQQHQRLESLGTLAGGIAHDFNNLLMGIQGRASLMGAEIDPDHPWVDHLNGIEECVKSAADLTRQLLGFARGGKYEVKPTNLNELVAKSASMCGRTRKDTRIHKRFDDHLWAVEVDRRQIEQVLLNIYVNAWQAMPGGGQLYLRTQNVTLDDHRARHHDVQAGRYAKISVTDTGNGMDGATLSRIFEPFFSTKEMGRGTGLGLASAFGIIKNHKGVIEARSKVGYGTTFNIYLPASEKPVKEETVMDKDLCPGTETILLVDDEKVVIDVCRPMLEKLGYRILVAMSGKEAIEIYKAGIGRIDLVILDLIMPDLNGADVFDSLKAIDVDVRVILASGFSINSRVEDLLSRGCRDFIQKPYKLDDLSDVVRKVLALPSHNIARDTVERRADVN